MDYFEALKEKMETWQCLSQARLMYREYMEYIGNDKTLRAKARVKDKNYPFKIFLEEYSPLLEFALLYCKDENAEIRYVGEKTQTDEMKYDGEIRMPDGSILTVEITNPIDGKRISREARQLNEYGYTEAEVQNAFEHVDIVAEMIIKQAEKKASKDYHNSILVIYCPDEMNFYRGLDNELHLILRKKVIQSIQDISFNAQEVYLLIPEYSGYSESHIGELITIK